MSDGERQALCRALGTEDFQVVRIRAISSTRNYRVITKAGEVFIKKGPTVAEECGNIRSLKAPSRSSLCLPEIVFFDAMENLLGLRFEKGRNLLESLLLGANVLARPFCAKGLRKKMERAGEWLAQFHAANPRGTQPAGTLAVEQAKKSLEEIRLWLTKDEKARIRDMLEGFHLPPLAVVASSEDFSPRNILCHGERMVVVDWNKVWTCPAYYNLTYFTTNVESRARMPGYSYAFQQRLVEAFLHAYAHSAGPGFDEEHYRMFKRLYGIQYLHEYEFKQGVFKPWKKDTLNMNRFMRQRIIPGLVQEGAPVK